jgi:hypothetical protein
MSRGVPLAERAPLSTLSSLLAARGVPRRAIEDAIARQVVHGSDLATNLLEVGGVSEELLLKVLAEATNLEPVALGSLPPSSHAALGLVSADIANQLNIIPLSIEGSVLKLIVAEPFVSPNNLGFGPTITVVQLVAPLARIRQAISKAYRIPLERRFTRLLGKLGEPGANSSGFDMQDEPTQVSIPLADLGIVRPPTQTPATLIAGGKPVPVVVPAKPTPAPAPKLEPPPVYEDSAVMAAPPASAKDSVAEPTIPQTVPGDVALAKGNAPAWATRAPIVQVVEPPTGWRPLTSDDMPETVPAPRIGASPASNTAPNTAPNAAPNAVSNEAANEEDAPVSRRTAGLAKHETARDRAAGGPFRRTVVNEAKAREQARQAAPEPPPQERRGSIRARRKGPFTAQMAEDELAEAMTTDVVLDILFTFSHQFFEYTVLFVVSGEWADGRDASGPGLTATQIKNVKIPLDQPSLLQLARERKAPVAVAPMAHGVDVQIIRDLAREARFADGDRAAVAVLPIVVRNRVVALLFGDDGTVDVELSALGDVVIILGRTVEALERVILRKKLGAAGRSSVMPAPVSEHSEGLRPVGLAALTRALDTSSGTESDSAMESEVASLPPTKSAPTATLISPAAMRSADSSGFAVRQDQPDVLPRSSRQAARSGGTNRGDDSTPPSGEPAPDGDVPDPAATSERSGPGSRRRRFLNGPTSRPRIAPTVAFDAGTASSSNLPQETMVGVPRSQRRGSIASFAGRGRMTVGPRPLPATLGKSAVRVSPGQGPSVGSATPPTLDGQPLPPTVQARRLRGLVDQTGPHRAVPQAERETVALLQRFVETNGADNDAGQAIVLMGERSVPAIMARFPGPLAPGIDRDTPMLPAASSCGPLFALLVAIGNDAVSHVAQRATSVLSEDRFWAAHVLGEIVSVESAEVVSTLLFDDDASVRRAARRATALIIATLPDAASAVVPMLEQAARGSADRPGRRFIALDTLGELAIPSTIPVLIALLTDPVQDVVDAVHRALVQITCQDFGRDARRWIDWFGANAGRHRVEWIIDALMHESVELRRIAADALAPVVARDLGYDPYESRDERAAAHVRYMLWWEQEGHIQFAQ